MSKPVEDPIIFFHNRDGAPIQPPPAIVEALAKRMKQLVRVPEYDQDGQSAFELRPLV